MNSFSRMEISNCFVESMGSGAVVLWGVPDDSGAFRLLSSKYRSMRLNYLGPVNLDSGAYYRVSAMVSVRPVRGWFLSSYNDVRVVMQPIEQVSFETVVAEVADNAKCSRGFYLRGDVN